MAKQFLVPGYGQVNEPGASLEVLIPGYGQVNLSGEGGNIKLFPSDAVLTISISNPSLTEHEGGGLSYSMFLVL